MAFFATKFCSSSSGWQKMDFYICAIDLSASVALDRNSYSLSASRILPLCATRAANISTSSPSIRTSHPLLHSCTRGSSPLCLKEGGGGVRQLKSTFISLFPLLPTKQDFFYWFIYQELLRQRKALAILTATPLCAGYQVRLGYS